MYYRDYQEFESIKKQYNYERIMDEINRAKTHKVEVKNNLDKFINECWNQAEVIKNTKIIKYVYFRRTTDYRTNRVKYEVGVMNSPQVENGFRHEWPEKDSCWVFGGREKKQAREYAEELAAQFGCEIRQ